MGSLLFKVKSSKPNIIMWWSGSYYLMLFFYIVAGILGVLGLVYCCYLVRAVNQHSHQSNIAIEQNRQHQQNNSDNTAIDMQPTRHQSSNQFQDNLPQNTYHSTKLSPTHLPYSIAPVDVPPPYPGNQSGTWINGSWVTNV